MSFPTTTLGKLIEIRHGFAFKGEHFADEGDYILLTPGNCYPSGGLRLKGDKEKFYTGDVPNGYVLRKNDLIVVMTDLVNSAPILGGSFIIPEDNKFLHNQRLGLIKIASDGKLDRKYAYYALNYEGYRSQVRGSASGATVRHTSPERIYRCEIPIPSMDEQRRIASTLSAYDNLINCNERRIRLLQQATQLLFEEWFVRLRYNGSTLSGPIGDVPRGWTKEPLANLLVLQRGFDLPAGERLPGNVPVFASTGQNGTHSMAKVKGPGVVTGRSGSLGKVMFVEEDYWPLNTTLWIKELHGIGPLFAKHLLERLPLAQFNGGAAVPTLNRNDLHRLLVLRPKKELSDQFEKVGGEMYRQVGLLTRMSERLAETRDLLLPRLLDGRVAV